MIKQLQSVGCLSVTLHVQLINKAAVTFYEKNGFLVDERLPNHYCIEETYYDALKLRFIPTPMIENSNSTSDKEPLLKQQTWMDWVWWLSPWFWFPNLQLTEGSDEEDPIENNSEEANPWFC